jgi:hypothetical protein
LAGTVWRIVLASLRCPSSAQSPRISGFSSISPDDESQKSHAPVGCSCVPPFDSPVSLPTARALTCSASAKERSAQSTPYQRLGNCPEFTSCLRPGNWFGLEHGRVLQTNRPLQPTRIFTVPSAPVSSFHSSPDLSSKKVSALVSSRMLRRGLRRLAAESMRTSVVELPVG